VTKFSNEFASKWRAIEAANIARCKSQRKLIACGDYDEEQERIREATQFSGAKSVATRSSHAKKASLKVWHPPEYWRAYYLAKELAGRPDERDTPKSLMDSV
jgi:plasmid replication initiation protein